MKVDNPLRALMLERIRARGPMTFATFMDLALYHPDLGYYARAAQRSGRAGDFFTSVDVGPEFGELLARQFAEMWDVSGRPAVFDLVEAGAGNGRLSRDVLDAAWRDHPDFHAAVRVHLVETSAAARAAHAATLNDHPGKLARSGPDLPDTVHGVVFANELLDALPCHAIVMTCDGLRELVVDTEGDALIEREAPLSTPAIAEYLADVEADLAPGWRAEVNLRAKAWVQQAARRLSRGFLMIVDYGHEARELFSATHAAGTRTCFRRHVAGHSDGANLERAPWLDEPGLGDITAHVDLTTLSRTAIAEGLTPLGRLDQTYFLLGLGLADMVESASTGRTAPSVPLKRRLALKTLMLPGGLGSTLKVLIFAKHLGTPALRGCSYSTRLT